MALRKILLTLSIALLTVAVDRVATVAVDLVVKVILIATAAVELVATVGPMTVTCLTTTRRISN